MKKIYLLTIIAVVNFFQMPMKSMNYLGDTAVSLYFAHGVARLYNSFKLCNEVGKLASFAADIRPDEIIGDGLFLEPLKNPQFGISKITLGLGLAAFLSLRTLKTVFPSNPRKPYDLYGDGKIFGPALLLAGGFYAHGFANGIKPCVDINPVQIAVRLCEKYPELSSEKLHALISYIQNNSGNLLNQGTMLVHGGMAHMKRVSCGSCCD